MLYQASKVMAESFQPEAVAQDLIETMEKLIGYEYGAVLLLNESTQELVPLALSHKGHDDISDIRDLERIRNLKIKPGEGVVGWVVQHGKPARIGKTPEDPRYLSVRETLQSELCVPLLVRDKVIGVLNIETAKPNTYDERDENLEGRLEEERRLMYVGVTRARKSLTLSYRSRRKRARETVACDPSRFIDELGDEVRQPDRPSDAETKSSGSDRLASLKAMLG